MEKRELPTWGDRRVVMQFAKVARASRPVNHAQDARATIKLHQYLAAQRLRSSTQLSRWRRRLLV
jgi:hypothetical protein